MKENIKSKIKTKSIPNKKYIQNGKFETDFVLLKTSIIEFNESLPPNLCIIKTLGKNEVIYY